MQSASAQTSIETVPRRSKIVPLALAVILQVGLLFLAVFVVVLVPEFRSDPEFVARKKIYLPQKELEHKAALAEFQNAARSPMQMERMRTAAWLPETLPPLPEWPKSDFTLIERNPASLQSDALLGQSGLLAALQGMQTESSSATLFGIEASGQRILILFDNSTSVMNKAGKAGVGTDRFIQELTTLINGLSANTLFGLVPFSRSVGTFRDYMVAAGLRNKRAASRWIAERIHIQSHVTALPYALDGIQGAFTVAFQMEPDVIFLISDADFQRNLPIRGDVPWDDVERTLRTLTREYGIEPRIHFIGFELEAGHADAMEKIVRRYKGSIKQF
ncbi:MAG: hypothetical protein ACPG3X_04040 [Opitutales bacterium]